MPYGDGTGPVGRAFGNGRGPCGRGLLMGRARRGVEAGRSDDRSLEQRVTAIENALQEIKSLLKREGQA